MMTEQSPAEWKHVCFDDVVSASFGGGTPSTKDSANWDGPILWTTTAVIGEQDTILRRYQRGITRHGLDSSSARIALAGSLLVGTRVGVGKAVVAEHDVAINQDISAFVLTDDIRAEFAALYFKTGHVQAYLSCRKRGTTIQGVPRSDVLSLPVCLPPIAEQDAIVRALRAIQEAGNARTQELELERERRAALMEHLFTHGTRDEPTRSTEMGQIPESWQVVSLDDCAVVQTGVAKGRQLSGATVELPYLRVANVQDGYLDLTEMKTITLLEREIDRYLLRNGDIVLTEGGDFDKLGRGFLWSGEIKTCVHQNHVFAVRADEKRLVPRFLAYQFGSGYGKAYFLSVAHKTTNLACINTSKLKGFPVLIPHKDEQVLIAETLLASDNKISGIVKEIGLLDELFRAMLEELMTGRLSAVPLIGTEGQA